MSLSPLRLWRNANILFQMMQPLMADGYSDTMFLWPILRCDREEKVTPCVSAPGVSQPLASPPHWWWCVEGRAGPQSEHILGKHNYSLTSSREDVVRRCVVLCLCYKIPSGWQI